MSNEAIIPVFRRGYRLQWEQVQNCHVILYPEGMAKLNDSATAILELVDGKRSMAEIIRTLDARFPEAGGVGNDVEAFFAEAREQKWILLRESA